MSNFLGDIRNAEVFNVQLPQVGELTQLGWKLPNTSITVVTKPKNTHSSEQHRREEANFGLNQSSITVKHSSWTLLGGAFELE